ncbi:hypothetical protein QNH20_03360 [Neobacillus sp. WH10]|uniref:hypothetical protein n=1 Tax=Neobacillus sp. WH10 TaxID=3047873 RepID=UPI0024C19958|nr:hypothetical protein [Neobacillus sp. WH10]WHY78219.1 hypothetical protein QNH20_03360 [Neobacillus sp. WH10]
MMLMVPLLITAIIVIALAVLTARAVNKNVYRKGKYSYSQRVCWIFSGYVAVLLICVVLDTVHPVKIVDEWKKVDTKVLEKESTVLYDTALAGKIANEGGEFLRKKWNFDYNGQQLNIAAIQDEYLNTSVVVERKNHNDGKIEAAYYQTRSSVNGMDITELANPPGLELAEDGLLLRNPKKSKIKFSEFTNVFSVKQFTEEDFFGHDSHFSEGQSILYLRIPKDLELIDKTNINLNYVE